MEGIEACGKSTQAAILAHHLDAVLTREPGGTPLGEHIRELLLDPALLDRGGAAFDARAEALLMAAARAQHVAEVVRPALDAGRDVVSDRFSGSSLAYQGYGRGLDVGEVRRLSDWATAGLWPDVTILVDVPEELSYARRQRSAPDRFEAESLEFHRRVAEGYRRLASDEPSRWRVIDGTGTVEGVAVRVLEAVSGASSDQVSNDRAL